MIKTAVIGASGYIGNYLFRKYRETFPDCIGTGFSRVGQDLTFFDLCHPNIDTLRLEETGHQAVIIASAMPNIGWCEARPKESYHLNVQGTLELVKQLGQTSIKTFFLSSDYVFNGETGNYSDDAPTSPTTEYGKQKAEVEREIPNLTDNYTILRLSKIYGTAWKDGTLIDAIAADLMQGKKITVATDQIFSPTHVEDVMSMLLFVQQANVNRLINLCCATPYSRHDVAYKLAEQLGVSKSLLQATKLHAIPGLENRPLNTSLQCSAILEKFQSSAITIEDSVSRVATHWKRCYDSAGVS